MPDLVDRLTGLCRDIARQAQAGGVTLGAPTRDDLDLLRAVLNGDPIRAAAESVHGGEGPGSGNDRQPASCATPTPSVPHPRLEDLDPGDEVDFGGHRLVVVSASCEVVELIAPDKEPS